MSVEREVYEFGDFRLDASRRALTRLTGEPIELTPKVFDVLRYLVEHAGELVEKKTLLASVWPDVIVEEHNLNKSVSVLRRALGDAADEQGYIATIPGRGYQFVRHVSTRKATPPGALADPAPATVKVVESLPADGIANAGRRSRLASWWVAGVATAAIASAVAGAWLWSTHSVTAGSVSSMSVAVLPFVSLDSPEEQYLGDGLTEELIVRLGRVPNLLVSPLTASLYFKGKTELPEAIASTLGVRYLLEGSVRRSGDHIRLGVRLIDTQRTTDPWQRTFDGARADLLTLQDQVSLAVVERLQFALLDDVRSRLTRRQTNSVEAQEHYFRARSIGQGAELDDLHRAIRYYEQATELDPRYVAAYIGWADTLLRASQFAEQSPEAHAMVARGLLQQALTLDPDAAGARAILAAMDHQSFDCDGAAAELAAGERADPGNVEVLIHLTRHYFVCDWDPAKSLDYAKRAAGRDPWAALHVTLAYYHQFDYEAALREADGLAKRFPDYWIAHWSRWWILNDLERYDEALQVAEYVVRLNDYNETQTCLAIAYARVGDVDRARQIYDRLAAREQYWAPSFEALLLVALGENARALDKLEEAYAARDQSLLADLHFKMFRPLHGEARFWVLVDKVNHRPQVEALIKSLETA